MKYLEVGTTSFDLKISIVKHFVVSTASFDLQRSMIDSYMMLYRAAHTTLMSSASSSNDQGPSSLVMLRDAQPVAPSPDPADCTAGSDVPFPTALMSATPYCCKMYIN